MDEAKINRHKRYYELSLRALTVGSEGYSENWCREASQLILELLDEVEDPPEPEYEYCTEIVLNSAEWSDNPRSSWGPYRYARQNIEDNPSDTRVRMLRRRKPGPEEEVTINY